MSEPNFIKLYTRDGYEIWVNVNLVMAMSQYDGYTKLFFGQMYDNIEVTDAVQDILRRI